MRPSIFDGVDVDHVECVGNESEALEQVQIQVLYVWENMPNLFDVGFKPLRDSE
jgi:hypothetical protein